MNYYFDTEFLEGTQKEKFPISLFRKNTIPTIDLISIGIVAEDGREYYAISKDFNLEEAWNRFDWKHELGGEPKKIYWIRENVLRPIFDELLSKSMQDKGDFVKNNFFTAYSGFSFGHLEALIKYYSKTNKQIAEEIKEFCGYDRGNGKIFRTIRGVKNDWETKGKDVNVVRNIEETSPKFYAYFADYDWVAFCWLFGKMMDLPNGFPMYCNDLKQLMDEKAKSIPVANNLDMGLKAMKLHEDFPKQENEHNALADARWNKKLHEFLNSL